MDTAAGSALVVAPLLMAVALHAQPAPLPAVPATAADQAVAEPVRAAEPARLAAKGLLIALAGAGERLVAVGDRGIIVLSDDRGASWAQADYVPSQALLTGVCFLDAQHGVAVGHDEVILTTGDGGRTWKRTHYAPQAQRPLLDVWCGTGGEAIAVGAYSAYLVSTDGGASWRAVKFAPGTPAAAPSRANGARTPAPAASGADAAEGAGGGYHLNRIVGAGAGRLYIAGEAGHLYASDDRGASWRALASPYEGSFFGVLPLPGEAVLAFGLRGHLYRSGDGGASWQPIETGTVAMLTGAAPFDTGAVAIVGLSGVVLVSRDGGHSFALLQRADRAGLSAVVAAGDDRLAVVGEDGAKLIGLGRTPGAAGSPSP
jgi:photosystem II stability/assembly factor-like uncharacterized protein